MVILSVLNTASVNTEHHADQYRNIVRRIKRDIECGVWRVSFDQSNALLFKENILRPELHDIRSIREDKHSRAVMRIFIK